MVFEKANQLRNDGFLALRDRQRWELHRVKDTTDEIHQPRVWSAVVCVTVTKKDCLLMTRLPTTQPLLSVLNCLTKAGPFQQSLVLLYLLTDPSGYDAATLCIPAFGKQEGKKKSSAARQPMASQLEVGMGIKAGNRRTINVVRASLLKCPTEHLSWRELLISVQLHSKLIQCKSPNCWFGYSCEVRDWCRIMLRGKSANLLAYLAY